MENFHLSLVYCFNVGCRLPMKAGEGCLAQRGASELGREAEPCRMPRVRPGTDPIWSLRSPCATGAGAGHGLCVVRAPPCQQPLACAFTSCPGHCLTFPSSMPIVKAPFCWLFKTARAQSKQLRAPLPSRRPRAARGHVSAPACRGRRCGRALQPAGWRGALSAWIMGALKS